MKNNKRVTIVDVAKEAGVSTGTASRVLNQRDGDIKISEGTRKLVIEAAAKLGYKANPFASALRTQRTGVLGVIVRDIGDPFLLQLGREIQKVARSRGVNILFAHAEYDLNVVGRQIAFMHTHWFDGLLLLGDIPGDQSVIEEMAKTRTPFVAVARGQQTQSTLVNIDEKSGIYQGMDYLRGLGHERIAFIGNLGHGGVSERGVHFKDYLREHGLPFDDASFQNCANSRSGSLQCAQELLSLPTPPTAIFCATDMAAYGAINGALRMGLNVPTDVSVLGFDDIEGSADIFPALTTLRQPVDEMATKAVELLLSLVEDTQSEGFGSRILVEPELVVRESCSSPKR